MNKEQETIKDTLTDLMGYAMIGLAIESQHWNDTPTGIRNGVYRQSVYNELDALFEEKLTAYGTKDLGDTSQILQRMKEKIGRIENLKGGAHGHKILVKKQSEHEGIHKPKKAGDVGFDLVTSEDTVLEALPGSAVVVPAGVNIKIPDGYWCQIVGRSSAAKMGVLVHTATIDNGYTGQLFACCWNMTGKPIKIEKGTRLAQVVFHEINTFELEEAEELPQTERGDSGFGSTGK